MAARCQRSRCRTARGCGFRPCAQPRRQHLRQRGRQTGSLILPREIIVPAGPMGLETLTHLIFAGEAQIADRDRMRRLGVAGPSAIGKGVELLDIAERMPGLRLDPRPQPRLQRAVRKLERTARQRAGVGDGHDLGLAVGDGDEHGDEISRDRVRRTRFPGLSRCPCHVDGPFVVGEDAASNIRTRRRRRAGEPSRAYRGRRNRARHSCRNGSYRNSRAASMSPAAAVCRRRAAHRAPRRPA